MARNGQSCKISLSSYLDSDSSVDDAFNAGAVTDDENEFYIDIDTFDRFALEKLEHLMNNATKTNSLEDITEYLNYATQVFSSKDDYISFIVRIWNWDRSEDRQSNLRQNYNCVKANYKELFEHYALAVDLWLTAEDNTRMPIETKND